MASAVTKLRRSAIFARDDLGTGARLLGQAAVLDLPLSTVEGWPARIARVTPADVLAAARAVLLPEASVTQHLLPAAGPS